MSKSNLLCTFVHRSDLNLILDFIKNTYQLDSNIIFVLSNIDNSNQLYVTYNVIGEYRLTSNTILMHRKSETNTLYTINALNEVVKRVNNGKADNEFPIPWDCYKNMMIMTKNSEIIKVRLKLEKIINISG